jgi:nucleoside 2-deoxyribosyltransferase
MRVYIAAPWVRRPEAIAFGDRLKALGIIVTSRWFTHEDVSVDGKGNTGPVEALQQQAREDVQDVLRSHVLVVLNLQKSEGKAVETGVAIANAIPVISVGKRSNIFQSLGIEVEDQDAAIQALGDFQKQQDAIEADLRERYKFREQFN